MIVRPVDGNGDMVPMTKSSQMLSGAAAVLWGLLSVIKKRKTAYS